MRKSLFIVTLLILLIFPAFIVVNGAGPTPNSPDGKKTIFLPLIVYKSNGQVGSPAGGGFPAFPGAMGFGSDTPGGRGGKVLYVTNLNDSGPGSLREALTTSGRRVVLFNVSGTITLNDQINITNPYLTVAGQTSPGEGVQIRGGMIKIATHDVIIRYLKVRSGDVGSAGVDADRDAITLNPGGSDTYNIIVDHSTLIWGPDIGGITFLNGARDSTVSFSIVGEGLYLSNHPESALIDGGHSMAMNITQLLSPAYPIRITVHHNLLTTSADRNPRVIGGENIDVVDNVIYNWQTSPSNGNPRKLNLIKNYYIRGPMTTNEKAYFAWLPKVEDGGSLRSGVVYESDNIAEGFSTLRGDPQNVYAEARFDPYSITAEDTPQDAYIKILSDAGANLQVSGSDGSFKTLRDVVDKRIINNLINRTGSFFNGVGKDGQAGFAAISWPELASGTPAVDSDGDGMPDQWEQRYFGNTSRGSANDSSGDYDKDGYTDLEEYLNNTDPVKP